MSFKPLKSNNFSNKHLESPDLNKNLELGNDDHLLGLKEQKTSEASNKIGTPYLQQTHNVNLMSTIKVTDLKLHFNADTVGAADSHRVFGDDLDHPLRGTATSMLSMLTIFGNLAPLLIGFVVQRGVMLQYALAAVVGSAYALSGLLFYKASRVLWGDEGNAKAA